LAAPAPRVEPQAATQALVPSAVAIPPSVPAALAGAPTGKQYAIQVVTYKNRQYAERELKRLQETGERGFIVTSQTHAVLFVGPFDSKTAAKEKMTSLRSRYSDCFLKTL
jgi:cell division septation protein DedD